MKKLELDLSKVLDFVSCEEIAKMEEEVKNAEKLLMEGTGEGNDFLGWINLPTNYNKDEFERIKLAAKKIRKNSEVLVVIGIGGSYLGARATIDFLSNTFYNKVPNGPEIYFAGNSISGTYLAHLIQVIGDRDFSVNVISKSGTTTEPAIAFRIFKEMLEKKYGVEGARERIFATTDASKGALKKLSAEQSYETFTIPDDVGGRFSVLTPVGLLPIAAAGIDIDALMAGAREAQNDYTAPYAENDCYKYAAVRNLLLRKGKCIELLINYEPKLHYVAEWWKQLYGESEGKDGKGLFPASVDLSTDLHSMGQYIQDGQRILFETLIDIDEKETDVVIPFDEADLDGLNYIAGKGMNFVNEKAMLGTQLAHVDGGVPNIRVCMPKADSFSLGYLFYFFEKSCGISGYLLEVNPFNQPGVEAYKKNMFALLGKSGYEKEAEALNKRLEK
ncbi:MULTISPECIES: glucose-6-phosphate isomerase [Fusobacterium]|uniref:glucose-6-phosphate isomerase n=1 Tax=Fusobacterium TaxID=848 RepID=UPI001F3B3B9A|nr:MULTISPECIES: glucose-6-phosphate isomerase [Fusobacterium]MCF2612025.1 glucose-6-phosphate isomerase [Fusobacterium perfoetens]MDY2980644.1 glucose-6-phosphate isomerase [Fusobacterium sp.]